MYTILEDQKKQLLLINITATRIIEKLKGVVTQSSESQKLIASALWPIEEEVDAAVEAMLAFQLEIESVIKDVTDKPHRDQTKCIENIMVMLSKAEEATDSFILPALPVDPREKQRL